MHYDLVQLPTVLSSFPTTLISDSNILRTTYQLIVYKLCRAIFPSILLISNETVL